MNAFKQEVYDEILDVGEGGITLGRLLRLFRSKVTRESRVKHALDILQRQGLVREVSTPHRPIPRYVPTGVSR